MSAAEEKPYISNDVTVVYHETTHKGIEEVRRADNVLLAHLGYRSEFKREFSVSGLHDVLSFGAYDGQLIETVAFSFSIMGVIASVSSTLSFPLAAGDGSLHEMYRTLCD